MCLQFILFEMLVYMVFYSSIKIHTVHKVQALWSGPVQADLRPKKLSAALHRTGGFVKGGDGNENKKQKLLATF